VITIPKKAAAKSGAKVIPVQKSGTKTGTTTEKKHSE
jgi:hypothetical protein